MRTDKRACFNQMRSGEVTRTLMASYGVLNADALLREMQAKNGDLLARMEALAAKESLTSDEKSERAALRKESRSLGRDIGQVEANMALTGQAKFGCFFVDDFPTLVRLDPPEDVTYRRVPDEAAIAAGNEGATMLVRQVKEAVG